MEDSKCEQKVQQSSAEEGKAASCPKLVNVLKEEKGTILDS